jgi:hypothetical protein
MTIQSTLSIVMPADETPRFEEPLHPDDEEAFEQQKLLERRQSASPEPTKEIDELRKETFG